MHVVMFLKQMIRKPMRTLLYVLVLILLTAFFCMSLNLYNNSQHNIRLAADTYTTIAVMELYADVDSFGNLVEDITTADDYAGYYSVTVKGYDITPIVNAPSVIKYDLRARYGAYSEGNYAMKNKTERLFKEDFIRFKIVPEEQTQKEEHKDWVDTKYVPDGNYRIFLYYQARGSDGHFSDRSYNLHVIESAADIYDYDSNNVSLTVSVYDGINYSEDVDTVLDTLNGGGVYDTIVIEPNTEYVIYGYVSLNGDDTQKASNGRYNIHDVQGDEEVFSTNWTFRYSQGEGETAERIKWWSKIGEKATDVLFPIHRYSDIEADPELFAKYEQVFNAYKINAHSFAVMATNDMSGVPAFHMGHMYVHDGRMITEEEYENGAKVCMINSQLAAAQGWEIGDKVNFDFYEFDYFINGTLESNTLTPYYTHEELDNFFDSGEYEIVGIYKVRPVTGNSEVALSTLSVPWNTIYIPAASVPNAPAEEDRQVTGALMTLWLENGKIEPFLEYMEENGITGRKEGDYEAKFTFYDQGYSRIQPSLEALSGTAELLLLLSGALLVIAALLLSFFYAQANKQSIGTMRLLGNSKIRSFIAVMLGAIIIALLGTGIGAYAGHTLTQQVAENIVSNADTTPEEYRGFSAYLTDTSNVEMEFALEATLNVTLIAGGVALVLFLGGVIFRVVGYLRKEPRELLPRAGE